MKHTITYPSILHILVDISGRQLYLHAVGCGWKSGILREVTDVLGSAEEQSCVCRILLFEGTRVEYDGCVSITL